MTNWLVFDIGTTGTKAALMTAEGTLIHSAARTYPTQTAEGGVVEQDALDWWDAVVDLCAELGGTVDAIALTGQMQDVILIDEYGEPVRPVILYNDTRARAFADQVNTLYDGEQMRQRSGTHPDAGSLLAKLMWLQQHEPALSAAHLLLGAADFIAFRMTGRAVTDTTTASTTGLLDLHRRNWLENDIFATLGIDSLLPLLPSLVAGGAQVGTLTDSAAAALGLRPGTVVHLAPGDAGSATLGAGAGESGQVYGYLGTSGWIAFTADGIAANPGVITIAHPRPDRTIQVAPLLTAGGNLDWISGLFDAHDYETLISAALDRPPTALLYLPYLNGERSPFQDSLARGAFIGISAAATQADMARAVLEGVVYAYRHALEALLNNTPARLLLTGGGTRSAGWCQLFADVLGIPVAVAADAGNVGVRGALLAARFARGEVGTFAAENNVQIASVYEPGGTQTVYNHKYGRFREAYPALKPIFAASAID
jgi:xylulokinase